MDSDTVLNFMNLLDKVYEKTRTNLFINNSNIINELHSTLFLSNILITNFMNWKLMMIKLQHE